MLISGTLGASLFGSCVFPLHLHRPRQPTSPLSVPLHWRKVSSCLEHVLVAIRDKFSIYSTPMRTLARGLRITSSTLKGATDVPKPCSDKREVTFVKCDSPFVLVSETTRCEQLVGTCWNLRRAPLQGASEHADTGGGTKHSGTAWQWIPPDRSITLRRACALVRDIDLGQQKTIVCASRGSLAGAAWQRSEILVVTDVLQSKSLNNLAMDVIPGPGARVEAIPGSGVRVAIPGPVLFQEAIPGPVSFQEVIPGPVVRVESCNWPCVVPRGDSWPLLFREAVPGPVLFQEAIPGSVVRVEVIPEPVVRVESCNWPCVVPKGDSWPLLFREAVPGPVLFQEAIPGSVVRVEAMLDPTADPVQLKKALEWELSLDIRDLRSHAWYHGAIPRHRAEEIVERDGDFVIRDCTSQPGNYVLTCRTKTQALHFVINKVVIQPDTVYERVQYQFEDDAYDTVPDLITFYVGSGKPISSASGARIQTPKNRLYPLSFYASKYGLQQQLSPLASPGAGTLRYSPYNSYKSPVHSPPRSKRETPPRLPCKKQRSHSLTPQEINGDRTLAHKASSPKEAPSAEEKSNSADGVIQLTVMSRSLCHHHDASSAGNSKYSTHSLPRTASGVKQQQLVPSTTMTIKTGKMVRVISDPALSPCMERRRFGFMGDPPDVTEDPCPEPPPPKPSRVPSLSRTDETAPPLPEKTSVGSPPGCSQRVTSYQASGSDSGNGSGDSAQSSAAETSHRGVIIKNPRYHGHVSSGSMSTSCSSATLKPLEYDSFTEDSLLMLSVPDPEPVSTFDLESFQTLLLPTLENKPLDATALQGVQMMLQETGSRILANHLTRVDLELTAGGGAKLGGTWDTDFGMGVSCGLELCALPHGHQLRQDLIERTQCLKLLVAVTILTCAKDGERAETINKWIQVAIDTKTALGNLYGFCGVMMGLCMPQIQRLTMTWHVLRQKFTDSAFNFEAKLRPTLKNMNEMSREILGKMSRDIAGLTSSSCSVVASSLGPWESTPDLGLGTLYAHLETARKFGESLQTFRRNAEIVLGEAKVDDLLTDTFRTEFHLKFLWGSRGAGVSPQDRHAKFEQVLSVMSEKCEPSTVVGLSTPV
uniref:Uncharacterized protein n=1 Tax=Timema bartmani TaxID=61472 RepID=A0A7R9ENJ4_9NEOP|nr:unnamed protein product [Timema bartmani]